LMAREFLSANPRATVRELANGIGCSKGLAGRLPAWKAVAAMKKAKGVKTPKVISFTPTIESQVGDRDAELAQLMGEQAEDKNRGHRLRRRV